MVSIVLFATMLILSIIFLMVAAICSTVAATDSTSSVHYNGNQQMRDAHQYLTVGSALCWASVAILFIMSMIGVFTGAFAITQISEDFYKQAQSNTTDLVKSYKAEKSVSSGKLMKLIFMVVLIIITVMVFIVCILLLMATLQIGEIHKRDAKANSAHTNSIIALITVTISLIMLIVSIFAYANIRAHHEKQLDSLHDFQAKSEVQLGLKPIASSIRDPDSPEPLISHI